MAKSLRTGKTHLIGLMVGDATGRPTQLPLTPQLLVRESSRHPAG